MATRDNFSKAVQETLAKRVGTRCSNPGCRQLTAGPRDDPAKSVNIGVAAHITAAAPGGPRYARAMSETERRSAENGIWLCQNCAKLIDNDPARYTGDLLRSWKTGAEAEARAELEGIPSAGHGELRADVIVNWRKTDIRSERHEYQLEVSIYNVGAAVLREYHLDVEMPTEIIIDHSQAVPDRSGKDTTLFRARWQAGDGDIFPGDRKQVLTIAYFMDSRLYRSRDNLFDRLMRATLYLGGRRLVVVEQHFGELQCF